MFRLNLLRLLAALTLSLPLAVQAGRSCEEKSLSSDTFRLAMQTAEQVRQKLDALNSDVVVLARVGQDLSKYKLRYSHAGLVYRTEPGGRWRVAHLLNDCGTDHSDLWYEGLGNFFLDDMFSFEAVVLIPPPELAARLKPILSQGGQLRRLHTPKYSLLAYPFATRYENSNTWVLETVAAASSREIEIKQREQAQMWLKLQGFVPAEIKLGPLSRLGGRIFKANVAFDDHPSELRYSDRIQTVSVESILNFFMQRKNGWAVQEISAR
ncbi:DUF2145 domain-containing protein [Neisseriaceae bacterium TC5R-5]|nr:DUF2145 domain-containing protein [Neisseriaceae bacterium TC5R-5]